MTDPQAGEPSPIQTSDFLRLLLGGFVATGLMSLVMIGWLLLGLQGIDLAKVLGTMLSGDVPRFLSATWWAGMLWLFINGTALLPLIYLYLVLPGRRGSPWLKGIQWGAALWLILQIVLMPMVGAGFFSRDTTHPVLVGLGSLIAQLVYGAALGGIVRPSPARLPSWVEDRAA